MHNFDLTFLLCNILVFILLISCVQYMIHLNLIRKKFKDVKSPFHLPLLGSSYLFLSKNYFNSLQKVIAKYNLPLHTLIGSYSFYVTSDPSEMKIILNHPHSMNKMNIYNFFKPLFGNALIVAPADIWKKNRKTLSKSFNQAILDNFVPVYYEKSCILVNILKRQNVDIFDCLEKYTFDSFTRTAMGVELDVQLDKKSRFVETITELQDIAIKRIFHPWFYYDWIYFNSPQGVYALKKVKELQDYVLKIIRTRRENYLQNKKDNIDDTKHKVLMDLLLEMEDEGLLSETQVLNEMNLMTAAATDTSASSMSFVLTLLGMYPEIQEKVYEEVIETVGLDREITHEDLPKLKYTERVINEGMRILPTSPVFGRLTTADIDIGTRILPKDTNIILLPFYTYRDPNIYKDPLKFDPERFLPEEISKRPPYSFLPFSGGPRNCIGLRYAYMIMKTVIANVVRNLEIVSDYKEIQDIPLKANLVMTCDGPLKCRFRPRKH